MAIPTKGSRPITHGGHRYRWYVRKNPTYSQAAFATRMTVAIERVGAEPGTVLVVNLRVSRPDNWLKPHQTALKPAMVCTIIDAALEAGWKPELNGSAFNFEFALIKDAA